MGAPMTIEEISPSLSAERREKARAGALSTEEMRQWIVAVRAGRVTASRTSAASRTKAAPINVDTMLDELDALK